MDSGAVHNGRFGCDRKRLDRTATAVFYRLRPNSGGHGLLPLMAHTRKPSRCKDDSPEFLTIPVEPVGGIETETPLTREIGPTARAERWALRRRNDLSFAEYLQNN